MQRRPACRLPNDQLSRRGDRAPSLDLHGLGREQALRELDLWLNRIFFRGCRKATVVCGRGRGVLLAAVAAALARHPLVEGFRQRGVTYAVEVAPRWAREA